MRRIVLLLASMSLAVLLACGVAFAAAVSSQPKNARSTVHTNDTSQAVDRVIGVTGERSAWPLASFERHGHI